MTREEAIARIKDHIVVHRYLERNAVKILEALDMAIKALEQPEQPGWIPCSRELPKESGTYTVTAYDGVTNRVTYAKYQKRLKQWELTGARAYWRVLAWMEKPKPWEGGQDDTISRQAALDANTRAVER